MLRLCSDSSRSYPGRSVRIAVPDVWVCALHGNMSGIGQKSAKAIVDKDSTTHGSVVAGNEPG